METTSDDNQGQGHALRVVFVNDVYELDLLAHFATAIRVEAEAAGPGVTTVSVLAGDFLGPSLLSSLDKGRGMVATLNECGVDFVCFGNHETDVPHNALLQRIAESKFIWINTNMPDLPMRGQPPLPPYHILPLFGTENGQHPGCPKVAFLGLLTDDPSLYRPDNSTFSGAPILPVIPTAIKYRDYIKEHYPDVKLICPLTHQSITADREFAKACMGFPVVIGGHDHEPYNETVEGCTIVKVGCDAQFVGVVDLTVTGCEGDHPSCVVSVRIEDSKKYLADERVAEQISLHKKVLNELDEAVLCSVPVGVALSSRGIRRSQVTVGTMLVSALRHALRVDCAMVNAGNIRGNTDYPPDQRYFTYSDLKAEVPFNCEIAVVALPGRVLAATIEYSRQWAVRVPPVDKGGFLQVDDGVRWEASTNTVTQVGGQALDPDRLYMVATTWGVITGMDNLEPIIKYRAENQPCFPHDIEATNNFKELLISYFSRGIWWTLLTKCGSFTALDLDGDGYISPGELGKVAEQEFGRHLGRLVVDNLMATADSDGDGRVSKGELLQVCLLTDEGFQACDVDGDGRLSLEEVERLAEERLQGDSLQDIEVVFSSLDIDQDSYLTSEEIRFSRSPPPGVQI